MSRLTIGDRVATPLDGPGVVELIVGVGADRVLWVRLAAPAGGAEAITGPFGFGGGPELAWLNPYQESRVGPEPEEMADRSGPPPTGAA